MHPSKQLARVAGFLYLLVVLAGPFVLIYVPGKLFVTGDAAATARNILEHQTLFRAHIVVGLVGQLCFVSAVLVLYLLLKDAGPALAAAMALLILIDTPLAFLGVANELATLSLLRGPEFLSAFEPAQRDALALLLIEIDRLGVYVSEVFWGLWLLPLGLLVRRSGFLPRLLGVWLILNGLAYLAISATGILWPHHYQRVFQLATPLLFGEVALMLWLLVVGVRARPPAATVPGVA